MKIFQKSVWCMLTAFFSIMLAVAIVGNYIASQYSAQINGMFDINPYEKVDVDGANKDTEYYKSSFYKEDGSYDDNAMRANSLKVSTQAAVESSVLLWNKNNALPLAKDSKINLFGISSSNYIVSEDGSGKLSPLITQTIKSACEDNGLKVNAKLANAYKLLKAQGYGRAYVEVPEINCYHEYSINEAPWSAIDGTTLGNVTGSLYQDAAIMIISRVNGEDQDTYKFTNSGFVEDDCFDDNYMDLSANEAEILQKLVEQKNANKISKVILLINSANAVQFKNISNYDIDACLWVGVGGNASYNQIGQLLSGNATPSGHLSDTFVYDSFSAPATENFGDFTFTSKGSGLPRDESYTHNTKYVVYQEGIYVGYRYYETRYADLVANKGNANSTKGVKAGEGGWSYGDEVAFPFGYGMSYTDFEYSNFSVSKVGKNYEVSLTIKNTGSVYSGKDVMQVYIQKPYTEYDKTNKIEKSAVELVGFNKTKNLAPNESQTLKVTVNGEDFKTYDAYGQKTYILEEGDYYLAVGTDAHNALNNILANDESNVSKMDETGNKNFSKKITVEEDDFETYSKSSVTSYDITNQFDNADINLYEGTSNQKITYLSRSDWAGTYPSAVSLACTSSRMVADMQYGTKIEEDPQAEIPKYNTVGEYGELTLAMLMDLEYNNPYWEALLDQLTWEESNLLCSTGSNSMAGAESVAAPGLKAKDGPFGIGIPNRNVDDSSVFAFPCEVNLSAMWNQDLIEEVGKAFGLEILHVGYTEIYGPGANIHRSAFSGRNAEYFSEDGFLSGKMLASEVRGLQSIGVVVATKHFLLNDQERNRYGVTVWANEQSIREIYLKAFEAGVTEGKMNGVMSSFNRIGCTWAGTHKGLLTEVLRNEWGFIGAVETDAGVGAHMLVAKAKASAIVAGQDYWMCGGSATEWNAYKTNATVCQAIREACHRILYTQLHSNAMNGVSTTAKIVRITTWWEASLIGLQIGVGVICGLCLTMTVLSFVFFKKQKDNEIIIK